MERYGGRFPETARWFQEHGSCVICRRPSQCTLFSFRNDSALAIVRDLAALGKGDGG